MARLVVSYLLVLSLLAGPLLCCCAAAPVNHERTTPGGKPVRKHCCGGAPANQDPQKAPAEKPREPGKCPCKEGGAKVFAAPEPTAVSAALLTLLTSVLSVALPFAPDNSIVPACGGPRFDHRSSSLSASELLYAHHNLRC